MESMFTKDLGEHAVHKVREEVSSKSPRHDVCVLPQVGECISVKPSLLWCFVTQLSVINRSIRK